MKGYKAVAPQYATHTNRRTKVTRGYSRADIM